MGWGGVGHVNVRLHLRREVDAVRRRCGVGWCDAKRVDQYVRSVEFWWNNRGNLLEALAKVGASVKKIHLQNACAPKRVHFLLFPILNSTLQVLTLVKKGLKAHMIQPLPNEKKTGRF